jgi:hypothetical protein
VGVADGDDIFHRKIICDQQFARHFGNKFCVIILRHANGQRRLAGALRAIKAYFFYKIRADHGRYVFPILKGVVSDLRCRHGHDRAVRVKGHVFRLQVAGKRFTIGFGAEDNIDRWIDALHHGRP